MNNLIIKNAYSEKWMQDSGRMVIPMGSWLMPGNRQQNQIRSHSLTSYEPPKELMALLEE